MDLPFVNALADRRMLLMLVRRDVGRFPDVQERPEARLHVVDIVMACLATPGGLRALRAALETMAPQAEGTRRARQLIEGATLSGLLSESELERARDLLRRAAQCDVSLPGDLLESADDTINALPVHSATLINVFDDLAARRTGPQGLPPALALLESVATQVGGNLALDLRAWVETQAESLEAMTALGTLRERLSTETALLPGHIPPAETEDTSADSLAEVNPAAADEAQFVPIVMMEPDSSGYPDAEHPAISSVGVDPAHPSAPLTTEGNGQRGEDPMSSLAQAAPDVLKLPQVWGNVPPRNPNFTGREGLLLDLRGQLEVQRETAVLPHALHGMGGVGKSQVAIEYVHRYRGDYDLIWWIPAEHPGQILTALTDLAHRLELDVSPEANSAVPAVREALSTGRTSYHNWLLVFDNAESLSDTRPFFPTGGAGRILVTSRNPEWAGVTRALEVDVFTRAESISFLVKRTRELTDAEADRLAEALGDLPLAIEQAAAWRVATGMPVDEYLRLLEEKRIELLELGTSPDYEISVAAAWNVSLDKLEQVNQAALQLLQVCSFFAPEPISRNLFAGSPSAPITEWLDETLRDPIKLARAIRDIQRYALAKFDHRNSTLQIHRLVQAVLVGRMDPDRQTVMRRGAHTLLANGDPNQPASPELWWRYQALLSHISVSGAVESDDSRVQQLVFNMVKFLYYWGDHDGCRDLAEQVHEQRCADLGEGHEHTLDVAKWRAWILWTLGAYAEAARINARSLELYRAGFAETDEGTLDAMSRVAIDLRTAGDFAGALALDREVVEGCTREFTEDDPATLRAAFHLGVSLRQMGAFAEALELDTETHRRQSAVLGETYDETMRTLNYLTMDQREAGDYLGARVRQEEVYELFVKVIGPENHAVTRAARNLAVTRRKAGDHDGARKLAEETLGRFRIRYGDDYPEAIAAALNLAVDLRQVGDLGRARELSEEALDRYIRVLGDRHPHTLCARVNLAIVLRLQGDATSAHRSNLDTLAALHVQLGPDHPISLVCATNLASDLDALGEHQAAYEHDIDTSERSRRALGVAHPSTLACGLNLALDLRALGRVQEADKVHADVMAGFRRVLGDRHPATLNALQSIRADCDMDPLPL